MWYFWTSAPSTPVPPLHIAHYPPIQVYLMLLTYLFCCIMNETFETRWLIVWCIYIIYTLFWKRKAFAKGPWINWAWKIWLIWLSSTYTFLAFNMHTFFACIISVRNLSKVLKDNYIDIGLPIYFVVLLKSQEKIHLSTTNS